MAIQNESGKARYEPNEAAIEKAEARYAEQFRAVRDGEQEGASDAPESGRKKKFSP